MNNFKQLSAQLGEAKARQFLRLASPEIEQRHQSLRVCLQAEDWEGAALIAHKLKATAYLYASPTLLTYIDEILRGNTDIIGNDHFLTHLDNEFKADVAKIKRYISII